MRGDAERAARDAGVPVPVTVVAGRAEALPARDREYDAAVLSLVLCSIDDPAPALDEVARALDEVARALVPGGVLRFYEHVGSAHRPLRLLERLVNLVWSRLAGGCHLDWDSVAAIRDAGFEITTLESFAFSGVTHVLGEARTPGAR